MDELGILISEIEKNPRVFIALVILIVFIGYLMYRVLLEPKLKGIKEIATANTENILGIKNDILALLTRIESSIERSIQSHFFTVSSEIQKNQEINEKSHESIFTKVEELKAGYHANEKRITLLEPMKNGGVR